MFDHTRSEFAWARNALASLLTAQELAAAARSTLNAHYTDAALVQAMWCAVQRLGFDGGAALEPGCGSFRCLGLSHRLGWLSLMSARHETGGYQLGLGWWRWLRSAMGALGWVRL